MKERHQLLSQTSVYLHQHLSNAQLTIDDLRSMVGQLSTEQLMQRLQHYGAKVAAVNLLLSLNRKTHQLSSGL